MEVEAIKIRTMEVVNDSSYPDPATEHDINLLAQMGAEISTLECGSRKVVYISDKPFIAKMKEKFLRRSPDAKYTGSRIKQSC